MLVQGRTEAVAIDTVCKFVKSDNVATYSKTEASSFCGFNSDNEDESKNNDESLQEAYEKMYPQ